MKSKLKIVGCGYGYRYDDDIIQRFLERFKYQENSIITYTGFKNYYNKYGKSIYRLEDFYYNRFMKSNIFKETVAKFDDNLKYFIENNLREFTVLFVQILLLSEYSSHHTQIINLFKPKHQIDFIIFYIDLYEYLYKYNIELDSSRLEMNILDITNKPNSNRYDKIIAINYNCHNCTNCGFCINCSNCSNCVGMINCLNTNDKFGTKYSDYHHLEDLEELTPDDIDTLEAMNDIDRETLSNKQNKYEELLNDIRQNKINKKELLSKYQELNKLKNEINEINQQINTNQQTIENMTEKFKFLKQEEIKDRRRYGDDISNDRYYNDDDDYDDDDDDDYDYEYDYNDLFYNDNYDSFEGFDDRDLDDSDYFEYYPPPPHIGPPFNN